MFSLRCLVTNQGLMPEISVAKNPKKLGWVLDLIFSCFTVGRTISKNHKMWFIYLFIFPIQLHASKEWSTYSHLWVFFFLLIPFVLMLESCIVYRLWNAIFMYYIHRYQIITLFHLHIYLITSLCREVGLIAGSWTRWPSVVPSNSNDSVVLWLYSASCGNSDPTSLLSALKYSIEKKNWCVISTMGA